MNTEQDYSDIFDWKFYTSFYNLHEITTAEAALAHWKEKGQHERKKMKFINGEIFDWNFYVSHHEDLRKLKTFEEAFHHYRRFGKRERRICDPPLSCSDIFDWKFYTSFYNLHEITTAEAALAHWKEKGQYERKKMKIIDGEIFDWNFYVYHHRDLRKLKTFEEAIYHYRRFGKRERRICDDPPLSCSAIFDWTFYTSFYNLHEITTAEAALAHWKEKGQYERKKMKIIDGEIFDWNFYVSHHEDLKKLRTFEEAFSHYRRYGKREGRICDQSTCSVTVRNESHAKNNWRMIARRILSWIHFSEQDDIIFKTNYHENSSSMVEVVVIDFRSISSLEFVFKNIRHKLGYHVRYTIVCTKENKEFMENLNHKWWCGVGRIIMIDIDSYRKKFRNVFDIYNSLLCSEEFWEKFSYEWVLLVQEDACIFQTYPQLLPFLQAPYDYYGAPWSNNDRTNEVWNGEDCTVGNGGLSLRRTEVMLKIVTMFHNDIPTFYENFTIGPKMKKYISNFNVVMEDVYFAYYLFQKGLGRVPPTRLAQRFSVELVETPFPTFGGHCWWLSNTRRNVVHSFIPDICRLVDKVAILASPFYFTLGGGEKYTSDIIRYLLLNGYNILFFSMSTVYEVFTTMRIFIKNIDEMFDRILVVPFSYIHHQHIFRGVDAELFYLLSNTGIPEIKGMANKNILMCQFPFDMEQEHNFYSGWKSQQIIENVMSYDSFILNSEFSKTHMCNMYKSMIDLEPFFNEIVLKMKVIHPICFTSSSKSIGSIESMENIESIESMENIDNYIENYPKKNAKEVVFFVMCARIIENFDGNNNKYIDVAIQTFLKLSPDCNYRLIIMGSLKSIPYYNSLCEMIQGSNKIKIIPNVSSELKDEILKKSHYILSLTGIKDTMFSSQEHFGISLFEGIHYGCIPISFQGGFPTHYIPNKIKGHLFQNEEQLFELLNSIIPSLKEEVENVENVENDDLHDYNKKREQNLENLKTQPETIHLLQSLTMESFHTSLSKII